MAAPALIPKSVSSTNVAKSYNTVVRGRAAYTMGVNPQGQPVKQRTAFFMGPNTARWRGLMRKWKRGALARNLIIAVSGSSVPAGEDATSVPLNAQGINHIPAKMAEWFNANGVYASSNTLFGSQGCTDLAELKSKHSGFDWGGLATLGSIPVQGGQPFTFTGAGWISLFMPMISHIEVVWRDSQTLGRTFSWSVDGGAETNVTTSGNNRLVKTTIIVNAAAAANHTIRISQVATDPTILSIVGYNNANGRREVIIYNWGIRGANSGALIYDGPSVTPNGGRVVQATFDPPDLHICEGGLPNDWKNPVTPLATVRANLDTHYVKFSPISDVLYFTPPFGTNASSAYATQETYVDQMYGAADNAGTSVIPWRETLGSYEKAFEAGFNGPDVHLKIDGNIDASSFICRSVWI